MDIKDLKIYIVEYDSMKAKIFMASFLELENVKILTVDIRDIIKEHPEIDCLVSPANAFGLMTGGYDAALSDILGWNYMDKVQKYIKSHYYGEQVVGTSFYLDTDIPNLGFIHTPTMQYPSKIKDPMVIYHCMRSTLIECLKHDIKCIAIPFFGGTCGGIDPLVGAKLMKEAYLQILNQIGNVVSF